MSLSPLANRRPALVLTLIVAACSRQAPPTESADSALADPGDPATAADVLTRQCERSLTEAGSLLAALESRQGSATVEDVLSPYNELLVRIFETPGDRYDGALAHPLQAAAACCTDSVMHMVAGKQLYLHV